MEHLLLSIFLTIAIATVLNILLKRFGISHIIGYIATGTIISTLFGFNGLGNDSLDLIGEFGIVFLMFTIGLELSLGKIKKMKEILLANGLMQVVFSVVVIFFLSYSLFRLDFNTSLIIALAFSLSSTAIVLTYLKEAKAIIITMSSEHNRRLISEAVLNYSKEANVIIKIDCAEDRKSMRDLTELEFVDASFEIANLLVKHALKNEYPQKA